MVNDFANPNKYIRMEDFSINYFFYDEDLVISAEDLKYILPLSKEYSSELWKLHINKDKPHFSLLSTGERQSLLLKKIDYTWQEDWNNGSYKNFFDYLKKNVKLNPFEKVIVFWSKECAVETSWKNFLIHWPNFLFEDEGVIVINTINKFMLLFTSDGNLHLGRIAT